MQKRSTADFSYRLGTFENKKVLLIWDLDLGNRSVTNDIVNVINDIGDAENIDPVQHFILYRDSIGRWDGWDAARGDFFPVADAIKEPILEKLLW